MNVRTERGHRGVPKRLGQLLGAPRASGAPVERFRPTLAFIGLVVYLWVIHSAKAPLGAAAILLALVGLLLQPYRLRLPLPLVLFGLFILWSAATAPMALYPEVTSDRLLDYAKLWLIFLVTCNVSHTRRQLYVLIIAWLGIFALYPVRGTFFNFLAGIGDFGRYSWNFIFANPNDLAALTLPVLALCVVTLQGELTRGWVRMSALAGVVVLPVLIVLTQSRGGILALLTLSFLIMAQYRQRLRAIGLAVLAAGVIAIIAPPEVWVRLEGLTNVASTETLSDADAEGSAEGRYAIWQVASAIIVDHPVVGVGLGGYGEAHREYADRMQTVRQARGPRDTHSIYLNVAAETGLVGLALLLAMAVSTLRSARNLARVVSTTDSKAARQLNTLVVGLMAFMQAGLFASLHRVAFLYVYLGIIAAASAVFVSQVPGDGRAVPRHRRAPATAAFASRPRLISRR